MGSRCRIAIDYARPVLSADPNAVRVSDATLYCSIFRLDDELLANTHFWGNPAAESPVFHLRSRRGGGIAANLLRSFERVWTERRQRCGEGDGVHRDGRESCRLAGRSRAALAAESRATERAATCVRLHRQSRKLCPFGGPPLPWTNTAFGGERQPERDCTNGDKAAARHSEWSAPGTGSAIVGDVGVGCLQLGRLGGHELAPANYRERGKQGRSPSRPENETSRTGPGRRTLGSGR